MTRLKGKKRVKDSEDDESESESGSDESDESEDADEESAEPDGLNEFEDSKEECKLVLVVRTDLGMGKGTHAAWT